MARDVANVQTALWGNPEWKSLKALEQWLYLHLLSHPTLSYAGVVDWFPKRLAAASQDLSAGDIEALGAGLQDARFVLISEATDEVLVRSFLRHDGLLKQPKLSVSMANAFAAVGSIDIQRVIVWELQKLGEEHPEWKAFESDRVRSIMKHEGVDMDDVRANRGDDLPKRLPIGLGGGLPQTEGNGLPIGLPLPTATTTATSSKDDVGRSKRATQMPSDWKPSERHEQRASELGVDLQFEAEQFTNHHLSKGSKFVDWGRAFSTWLGNAKKFQPAQQKSIAAANSLWTKEGPF